MGRFRRYRNGFTLIELLAVVALISILMAIGVPAFARMIRSSRVDDTARSIRLALEQAQMCAADERRYVAVIFPNGPTGSGSGKVSEKLTSYRLGGYRLAYVRKVSKNRYEFVDWVDGSDWSNAPGGAVLTQIAISKFTASDAGDVSGCTQKITDKLKGCDKLNAVTGVKDDDGKDIDVGDDCAVIFNKYGGTENTSKLYLLISEASVNGDDIAYPAADGRPSSGKTVNYRVLKVNNLTGRVGFTNE